MITLLKNTFLKEWSKTLNTWKATPTLPLEHYWLSSDFHKHWYIIKYQTQKAKCRFAQEVNQDDVEEAIRLMEISQETIQQATENEFDSNI